MYDIAINVSKSITLLFVKAARLVQKPKAVQFLSEPIQWVETARYLAVALDTQLTWSAHVSQVGRKAALRYGVLGPLGNTRSGLFCRNDKLLRPMKDYVCPIWRSAAWQPGPDVANVTIQVPSHCD